jgi:hypothetical protein
MIDTPSPPLERASFQRVRRGALATLLALPLALALARPTAAQPVLAPGTPARELGAPRASIGAARPEPGSELTVYLVTVGQGDEIWERFGHSAIWIHDATRGIAVAYNWGLFDFAQPGFVRRFLQGHMLYWMDGFDAPAMLREYVAANRSVWVQRLHLSPAQRKTLRDFVQWNAREENKYYRYDYYRDNCSTRVRDALDRALGGQIREATDTIATGTTYRWHTRLLMEGDRAAYTGIELGLGHPADRPISAWEEMFLPVSMHNAFNRVRVRDAATRELVPLVESDREVFRAARPPEPTAPPRWIPYYLIAGLLLGALFALLGRATARGSRAARFGLASVGALWSLVIGLLGTFLILAWTLTDHVFTHRNENVLQATPLSLALVVLLPLWLYRRRGGRAATSFAVAIAALSVVGLVMQILPWFDQVNGESIALILPAQAGLAVALLALGGWRLRRPPAAAPQAISSP